MSRRKIIMTYKTTFTHDKRTAEAIVFLKQRNINISSCLRTAILRNAKHYGFKYNE